MKKLKFWAIFIIFSPFILMSVLSMAVLNIFGVKKLLEENGDWL